jgi:hypothetical protein
MLHNVNIYAMLYNNLCSAWFTSSKFLLACSGNENIIQICVHAMETHMICHNFLDLHKNINRMHTTPIFFGSAIKIGFWIPPTRAINLSHWLVIYVIIGGLYSKLKIFTLELGDVSTSEPHVRFFTQCTGLQKYVHRIT